MTPCERVPLSTLAGLLSDVVQATADAADAATAAAAAAVLAATASPFRAIFEDLEELVSRTEAYADDGVAESLAGSEPSSPGDRPAVVARYSKI